MHKFSWGAISHYGICWKSTAARHIQSRRFLQCPEDNFIMQVVGEPMRKGGLLDLDLMNKEGLSGDVGCEQLRMQ